MDWDEELSSNGVAYDGSEVFPAEQLELDRVLAALPAEGTGGIVEAADYCTGFIRDAFLDPQLL
eukprot:6070545-Karenia_brevis.AAC.1